MEIASSKLVYLALMLGIWFVLFLGIGRLMFFDSWKKFGTSLIYAIFIPWQLAFVAGENEQDTDSGMSVFWLLIITVIATYSFHAGMGDTIQGMLGIEPPPE